MPDRQGAEIRTILCVSRNVSGRRFIDTACRLGVRVLILTVAANREVPCEAPLAGSAYVADLDDEAAVRAAVRELAANGPIDRIVAMAEKDVVIAARLRQELGIPGMGVEVATGFRDKLLMRRRAARSGVRQPDFALATDDAAIETLIASGGPWVLKIRDGVGAQEVRRFEDPRALLAARTDLGARAERYLIERYVAGPVFHVDALVRNGRVVFHNASRYGVPMLDLQRQGGHYVSFHIERGTALERALSASNAAVLEALELEQGVSHCEYIQGPDGAIHFLEAACRVGAAHTPKAIEAARGVSLYEEWARMSCLADYAPPQAEEAYAGVIFTVAKHGPADLRGYTHQDIVWRSEDPFVPGLLVRNERAETVEALLKEAYGEFNRFV